MHCPAPGLLSDVLCHCPLSLLFFSPVVCSLNMLSKVPGLPVEQEWRFERGGGVIEIGHFTWWWLLDM